MNYQITNPRNERQYQLLIDEEDAHLIKKRLFVSTNGYPVWTSYKDKKQHTHYLHREIMKATKGIEVDHINGNRLDNRKINLRLCTRTQNSFNKSKNSNNTSGYKGVTFCKRTKKFHAQVNFTAKNKRTSRSLGYYDNPEDAHKAYLLGVKEIAREFINRC